MHKLIIYAFFLLKKRFNFTIHYKHKIKKNERVRKNWSSGISSASIKRFIKPSILGQNIR